MVRAVSRQELDLLEGIENDADALFIERFRPKQWWPASTGEERAAVPGFILVVDDEEGSVVGFVHIIESDGVAHLEQLSVLRSAGRRGFGRALVQAAKAEGARCGYKVMTLRTYADVPWNAPFYESVGFLPGEPVTAFHRNLLDIEAGLGLNGYGRRLQMTADLPTDQ